MNKKLIEITNCSSCPYCAYHCNDRFEVEIIECDKLKKKTFEEQIPEWCPLPDAESL